MKKKEVSEKELKIIEEIAKNKAITQRELSKLSGLSLGMVNITLKKLIKRGYVKARRMNKRSLEYILTPKGFSEKAKKSYKYFWATLTSLRKIKEKIQSLVLQEYSKGARKFVVLGNGELADIVEISLRKIPFDDLKFKRVKDTKQVQEKDCVILSTEQKYRKIPGVIAWINVIDEIAK